ncbi:MAG: DoxX family protein [Thermosynechococcaceae cyanobacterium]
MQYLPLTARICLSLIFVKAGISHLLGFSSFQQTIAGAGLPLSGVLAVGTIAFQLLGSLSLLLGYRIRLGAGLLILFLVPASLLFHNLIADPEQTNAFLKNLGLMGGLFMIIYAGAGPLSIDNGIRPDRKTTC